MITKKKRLSAHILILSAIFLFFFIMGYLLPYTHDDWAWGTDTGLKRLQNLFDDYNGRWMGNLAILLLSRFRLAKAAFYGGSILTLSIFATKILNNKKWQFLLLIPILLLCLPTAIFSQTFGWTSGFANYILGIVFALPAIYVVVRRFEFPTDHFSRLQKVALIVVSFCGQLFMEHITLYMVFLYICANIVFFYRNKRLDPFLMILGITQLAGAFFMFSNSAYFSAFGSDTAYQDVMIQSSLVETVKSAAGTFSNIICKYMFLDQLIINLIMGISC